VLRMVWQGGRNFWDERTADASNRAAVRGHRALRKPLMNLSRHLGWQPRANVRRYSSNDAQATPTDGKPQSTPDQRQDSACLPDRLEIIREWLTPPAPTAPLRRLSPSGRWQQAIGKSRRRLA